MRIALIGYGKMGKAIEKVAEARGHQIVAKIAPHLNNSLDDIEPLKDHIDLLIDFSKPQKIKEHVAFALKIKRPLIIGTTGWYEELPQIEEIVNKSHGSALYAPNFSIGIHLFLKIVKEAAKIIYPHSIYDVAGYEIHHNQKKDTPSGTGLALVNTLLEQFKSKKTAIFNTPSRELKPEELHFNSLRVGHTPGTHEIIFDSQNDTITLCHEARNREGFAQGAIIAGEWILHKKGFFSLDDLLNAI